MYNKEKSMRGTDLRVVQYSSMCSKVHLCVVKYSSMCSKVVVIDV